MSYLDFHRKRMKRNSETDYMRDSFTNSSKEFINSKFASSPLYKKVLINGEEYEVRMIQDKLQKGSTYYEQKELLFRPDVVVNSGSYVDVFNEVTREQEVWLLMHYISDVLMPKGIIRYCNKWLDIKDKSYPCVVTTNVSASSEVIKNNELVLPKGHLLIYIQANAQTQKIIENDRFVIDGNAYEVQTMENVTHTRNGIGFITLTVKKVPKTYEEKIEVGKDYNETVTVDMNTQQVTDDGLWGGW